MAKQIKSQKLSKQVEFNNKNLPNVKLGCYNTHPTYSIVGARDRAAEESNAIGLQPTPNADA